MKRVPLMRKGTALSGIWKPKYGKKSKSKVAWSLD
jgi:hypothetical protein